MQKYEIYHRGGDWEFKKSDKGDLYLVNDVDEQIAALQAELQSAKQQIDHDRGLQDQIAALKGTLEYRKQECESWAKSFHGLDKNYDELERETNEEIAALKARCAKLKNLCVRWKRDATVIKKAEIERLNDFITDLVEAHKESFEQKATEIAALQATIDKIKNMDRHELDSGYRAYENLARKTEKIAFFEEKLAQTELSASAEIAVLQARIKKLEGALEKIITSLEAAYYNEDELVKNAKEALKEKP